MEECETKAEFLQLGWLRIRLEFLIFKASVVSEKVILQTTWGLVCHLDPLHKNRRREHIGGHRCQPYAELLKIQQPSVMFLPVNVYSVDVFGDCL